MLLATIAKLDLRCGGRTSVNLKMAGDDPQIISQLMLNASIQIFVSTIFGFIMLIPMQPWAKYLPFSFPSRHSLLAVHLDWYMLAFMELGCGLIFYIHPKLISKDISRLLMFGGWINPLAYLLRDYGINAFVLDFTGSYVRILSAIIAGISACSILYGWGLLILRFYRLLSYSKST